MSGPADSFGYPVVDLPPSATSSPEAAVRFLVAQLVQAGRLRAEHADRLCCQVLHRESLCTTAIGGGFALPHAKSDAVGEVLGIVGSAAEPVNWPEPVDGKPVRVVCLLVTPVSEPGTSLRALVALSRRIRGN